MRFYLRRLCTTSWLVLLFGIVFLLNVYKPTADVKTFIYEDDPIWQRRQKLEEMKRFDGVSQRMHQAADVRYGWAPYLQYKWTGDRIWPKPASEDEDRILNQIHMLHHDVQGKKLKTILMYDGLDMGMSEGQGRFVDHNCPVNQCSLTAKLAAAKTADAILFKNVVRFPMVARPSSQIWILFNLESPHHTSLYTGQNNVVNWTATYRTDSVMVAPYEKYAYFKNFTALPSQSLRNFAAGKTKLVAWFVSNCQTPNGRMHYVRELQKYINVDIYGQCSSVRCSRSSNQCFEKLKTDYKFYLSFENSNCKDYITEKFFVNALA